jgi:hypothetical protein
MKQTRQKLLENFDEEVHEKLRVNQRESTEALSKYDHLLWQLTRFYLQPYAKFEDGQNGFTLIENPFPEEQIHPGPYRSGKNVEDANLYRLGHPLAQRIIERCKAAEPDSQLLAFACRRWRCRSMTQSASACIMRNSSCAFSKRDRVGCEARSSPSRGFRPTSNLWIGSHASRAASLASSIPTRWT